MVEELELSYIAGRGVDWCIHSDLDKEFLMYRMNKYKRGLPIKGKR